VFLPPRWFLELPSAKVNPFFSLDRQGPGPTVPRCFLDKVCPSALAGSPVFFFKALADFPVGLLERQEFRLASAKEFDFSFSRATVFELLFFCHLVKAICVWKSLLFDSLSG